MEVMIAPLGARGLDGVQLGAYKAIKEHFTVFRTARNEAAQALLGEGVAAVSLDGLYESAGDFDSLCASVADAVAGYAKEHGKIVYAVPSGAGFGDATIPAVLDVCRERGIKATSLENSSYFESAAFLAGGLESAIVCTASAFLGGITVNTKLPLVVTEVDGGLLAGEIKLRLLEFYPEECEIFVSSGGGTSNLPLFELDRMKNYSHNTTIILKPLDILALSRYDFIRLLDLIAILRGRGDGRFEGCPWDMEQTHQSLKQDLLEETYEVLDAIERDDPDAMTEELGDLLLQVVIHAQIASEFGEFDIGDVTSAVCRKLISRHRHIFGDAKAETTEDVLKVWEASKSAEKALSSVTDTLRDVPKVMSSLMRAQKVLKRAKNAGFCEPGLEMSMAKIAEELSEIKEEAESGGKRIEEEIGDMLLACAKIPMLFGVDAELALKAATCKYIERFAKMEDFVVKSGGRLSDMTIGELDEVWKKIKGEK